MPGKALVKQEGNDLAKVAKGTFVPFVLDETGSMSIVKEATIGGFNEYVDTLRRDSRANGFTLFLTLVKFDSLRHEVVERAKDIHDVAYLTPETYQPGAATPLYDAIGKTIQSTEEHLASIRSNGDPEPVVLFTILTDGEENASREFTREKIFELIKKKEAEGWKFAFLGANQDAYAVGGSLGISPDSTMHFAHDTLGTTIAFANMASSTTSYATTGGRSGGTFTDQQRKDAGDEYWAKHKPRPK